MEPNLLGDLGYENKAMRNPRGVPVVLLSFQIIIIWLKRKSILESKKPVLKIQNR